MQTRGGEEVNSSRSPPPPQAPDRAKLYTGADGFASARITSSQVCDESHIWELFARCVQPFGITFLRGFRLRTCRVQKGNQFTLLFVST
ncbi:hypothetical protein F2P81_019216 [Scophthalmus maximus]|uniref:Uncharacterized protein n=1 Tax=Scophthalmus maximus TaxID=52904 RepID=A0A6A4S6I0_SCOMX|nr:hypothetical protein F2P81_019216 [Scophthalmus maximus]